MEPQLPNLHDTYRSSYVSQGIDVSSPPLFLTCMNTLVQLKINIIVNSHSACKQFAVSVPVNFFYDLAMVVFIFLSYRNYLIPHEDLDVTKY